ncbi:hypothetical protein [Gardnerella sp. Marseille-Q2328]|uniref:hypothetical protein n=1 Tax=Gardnerella sp. Marseille-Q2328 TaxID=2759694 RepID=UPI0020252633|nr:hypothetical protein [Gardnerella sp. Marseille-Q2328]
MFQNNARTLARLTRAQCCAQAGRQRLQNTTKIPINNHTNLPCLRQSRRRQTSLALKARGAFNLSKLGAPSCFRALNRSAKAGRRAHLERLV